MYRKRRSRSDRYKEKSWLNRLLEKPVRIKNAIPIVRQYRAFKARRSAFKRKVLGTGARIATAGYVKPLSHPKLKPCKGVRKEIKRAYFAFKRIKNWKRGGNRSKDVRTEKVAKSRFTVLNCK